MMNNTLYFQNKLSKKQISKKIIKKMTFSNKFKLNKNIYLENSKYLIVISKYFIRVLVFHNNTDNIVDIKNIINSINTGK